MEYTRKNNYLKKAVNFLLRPDQKSKIENHRNANNR